MFFLVEHLLQEFDTRGQEFDMGSRDRPSTSTAQFTPSRTLIAPGTWRAPSLIDERHLPFSFIVVANHTFHLTSLTLLTLSRPWSEDALCTVSGLLQCTLHIANIVATCRYARIPKVTDLGTSRSAGCTCDRRSAPFVRVLVYCHLEQDDDLCEMILKQGVKGKHSATPSEQHGEALRVCWCPKWKCHYGLVPHVEGHRGTPRELSWGSRVMLEYACCGDAAF